MGIKSIKEADFENEVIKCSNLVVVDFWAPWCGPCKMLSPIIEEVATQLQDKVNFVKINTDENPRLATQYQIRSIPTLLFFKDGKEIDRSIGVISKQELIKKIDKLR